MSSSYIFGRHQRSTLRLNYQHWCIKQLFGYLLHKDIAQQNDGKVFRIADIGAGTGIWPIEIHQALSPALHLRVDGFDVSDAQYPLKTWVPNGVHLHIHDAFNPFPEEHLGKYDVVHLRFFVTLLNPSNIERLLTNLVALLKPGGYLQWIDLDPLQVKVVSSEAVDPIILTQMLQLIRSPRPAISYDWLESIQSIVSGTRAALLVHERVKISDALQSVWMQVHLLGYEEYLVLLAQQNDEDLNAEELAQQLSLLVGEFAAGASLEMAFFCVVARKETARTG